jgi:uroporphyrinogen III methyltransferase/synthase
MKPVSNLQPSASVALVGAGPGDPGLITVRGRELLEAADVVVYDSLIGAPLLELCRANAEKIYVGKRAGQHAMKQEEINALLVRKAQENKSVCRLKGGDPFVFGRGGEEALFCRENGVPFEIVPGVTSAIAAPAYAGIPVTQRGVATSFAVVTGHTKTEDGPPPELPVADTLIFLMGVRALPSIVERLRARGAAQSTPVALVRWGTTTQQQVVTGTLETIVQEVERAQLQSPALIIVGEVVRLREQLRWFDARPLCGQTILVTRAREQASSLVESLEKLGARVFQCPTIRLEALPEYSVLDAALDELSAFDWVVFTSANGVEAFWRRLRERLLDARALANAKIAAIGLASAAALEARGLIADFVPESSISESVAAGLIERGATGRLLIARAQEGRDVLQRALEDAGARVTLAPCYRTVPDHSNAEAARRALQAGEVDWVTFTSSSTVRNFLEAIGEDAVQAAREKFRVACIGPITARTARECGLAPDAEAATASVEALIEALLRAS